MNETDGIYNPNERVFALIFEDNLRGLKITAEGEEEVVKRWTDPDQEKTTVPIIGYGKAPNTEEIKTITSNIRTALAKCGTKLN